MGGLGARGRGLELRPEWAEGLPGGVSVVTGRQMLGGSGGCLAAASAEVPFGWLLHLQWRRSEVISCEWGWEGGMETSSTEEPVKMLPRQVKEETQKRMWRLARPCLPAGLKAKAWWLGLGDVVCLCGVPAPRLGRGGPNQSKVREVREGFLEEVNRMNCKAGKGGVLSRKLSVCKGPGVTLQLLHPPAQG